MTVYYGIGDASGKGFRNILQENKASSLDILISRQSVEEEQDRSSNQKEFSNIVATIKKAAEAGKLKDAVLFMLTDNSTVEDAIGKGNTLH